MLLLELLRLLRMTLLHLLYLLVAVVFLRSLLPIRCDFEVKGIGRWQCDVPVFLPSTLDLAARTQLHR